MAGSKESPAVGKKKCPICGVKSDEEQCKCGHVFRPSD